MKHRKARQQRAMGTVMWICDTCYVAFPRTPPGGVAHVSYWTAPKAKTTCYGNKFMKAVLLEPNTGARH